jgi:hypothetical protein
VLRNIPEDRIPHLRRDGRLKSRVMLNVGLFMHWLSVWAGLMAGVGKPSVVSVSVSVSVSVNTASCYLCIHFLSK